jgi:hypothetical protein
LVEAPGTAPGSEWFIATAVYFHSRRTGNPNIGSNCREGQALSGPFRRVSGPPQRVDEPERLSSVSPNRLAQAGLRSLAEALAATPVRCDQVVVQAWL